MAVQRKDISFGSLSNSLFETVEAETGAWSAVNVNADRGVLEGAKRYGLLGARAGAHAGDIGWGLGYGKYSGNEVQVLEVTGSPTGGTLKLEYDGPESGSALNEITANIDWDSTASEVQSALEALASLKPGDVACSGGPWPVEPIEVEFKNRLAQTDIRIIELDTNSLTGGTTPTVAISEKTKGGDFEEYLVALQHNGDPTVTVYSVDPSTGTYTAVAGGTGLTASDWFFVQYADRIYAFNPSDKLNFKVIGQNRWNGKTSSGGARPQPPTVKPTFLENYSPYPLDFTGLTISATNVTETATVVPTTGIYLKNTGSALTAPTAIVVDITWGSDQDWSHKDLFFTNVQSVTSNTTQITFGNSSVRNSIINASAVEIEPTYVRFQNTPNPNWSLSQHCHFADDQRVDRATARTLRVKFTVNNWGANDSVLLSVFQGRVWLNDEEPLNFGEQEPEWEQAKVEYAYSYWDDNNELESDLGPSAVTGEIPTQIYGCWNLVTCQGTSELTGSDRIYIYRKEKATGRWRRLPTDASNLATFGVANNPTGIANFSDKWMEQEIGSFPEPDLPSFESGVPGDTIGVWKQSLAVGFRRQVWLSWVGQPERFAPSPDDLEAVLPDPEDELRGSTEYLSDNRAEPIYGLHGQDSLYAVSPLSSYAKVGDRPALSSVFRRLPGSRGTITKRSSYRYGGGVLVGSQDGLWYYSVGRGFQGDSGGNLVEREETERCRLSWKRLLSDLVKLTVNATGGTFTMTFGAQTTSAIPFDAGASDIRTALEGLSTINVGDVEVFGPDLPSGAIYIRLIGQYAGTNAGAITANSALLTGGTSTATVETITEGGGAGLVAVEHEDEYLLISGRSYLLNTRNRRWYEGILDDQVKAVYADRVRGLVFIDSKGRLLKIGEGYATDEGTTVNWWYESPWLTGPRARIVGVGGVVRGAPTCRLISDDGAGGTRQKDMTLASDRFTKLNSAQLPGVKHKLVLYGTVGTDVVEKLWLEVDGAEGAKGS